MAFNENWVVGKQKIKKNGRRFPLFLTLCFPLEVFCEVVFNLRERIP